MANQRVTDLDAIISLPDSGIIHVIDTTITTQNAAGSSFKITKANLLKENTAAILLNTAKVGISTAQATAITNNTNKVGYTAALVAAAPSVVLNTAKVGITTAQATAITDNTLKLATGVVLNTDLEKIIGKNLFNFSTAQIGFISNLGVFNSSSLYRYSEQIAVIPGRNYNAEGSFSTTQQGYRYLAFYNSSGVFISGIDGTSSVYLKNFTAPVNSATVVVSLRVEEINVFQVEFGSVRTVFESYKQIISKIKGFEVSSASKILGASNTSVATSIKKGFYISNTTGLEVASSNYFYATFLLIDRKFINVTSNWFALVSNTKSNGFEFSAFFDSAGVLISGTNGWLNDISVPSNATSVKLSGYNRAFQSWEVRFLDLVSTINGNSLIPIKPLQYVAYGDSTTLGADLSSPEVNRWSSLLGGYLGTDIVNMGVSGSRAEEITSYLGGVKPIVTITNGLIKGNKTDISITFNDVNPFRVSSFTDLGCALIRFDGTVFIGNISSGGNFKWYGGTGTDINVALEKFELVSLDGKHHKDNNFVFIGQGINNEPLIESGAQTIDDIINYYSLATEGIINGYLVWGVLDRGLSEASGTIRNFIVELEKRLSAKYGTKYFNLRNYLASQRALEDAKLIDSTFIATTNDNSCVSSNVVPESFRTSSSSVHLNILGHKLQSRAFLRYITYLKL